MINSYVDIGDLIVVPDVVVGEMTETGSKSFAGETTFLAVRYGRRVQAPQTDVFFMGSVISNSSMPDLQQAGSTGVLDAVWRTAYRLGFPVARLWWRLRRQRHEGALVAVHVGPALLLVRSSYRIAWNFPGGSIRHGETPEISARRELAEEIGIAGYPLLPTGTVSGIWDGRPDRVHFFELRLDQLPELRLDNREIVAARLVAPDELPGMALTGPVAAYLGGTPSPGCQRLLA